MPMAATIARGQFHSGLGTSSAYSLLVAAGECTLKGTRLTKCMTLSKAVKANADCSKPKIQLMPVGQPVSLIVVLKTKSTG